MIVHKKNCIVFTLKLFRVLGLKNFQAENAIQCSFGTFILFNVRSSFNTLYYSFIFIGAQEARLTPRVFATCARNAQIETHA